MMYTIFDALYDFFYIVIYCAVTQFEYYGLIILICCGGVVLEYQEEKYREEKSPGD